MNLHYSIHLPAGNFFVGVISIAPYMDSLGIGSAVKKREAERSRLRESLKVKIEEESRKATEATARTATLLAERDAMRKQEELKATIEEARDRGASDGGVVFEVTLRSANLFELREDSDRVVLPQKVLEELSAIPTVQYPLMFELFNAQVGARTHCGVLEFSASPGTVVLPEKVRRCLGLDRSADSSIRLRYKQLEKCKYLRCNVPASSLALFPDIRAFIESSLLHHHVTITEGDRLIIGNVVPMIVDKLEPDFACCLIDTDVNLDLSVLDEAAGGRLEKWTVGSSASFDKTNHSRVLSLSSDTRKLESSDILVIQTHDTSNSLMDIFVSVPPQLEANVGCFDLVSPVSDNQDMKQVRIELDQLVRLRPGLTEWPVFLTVGLAGVESPVQVETFVEKMPVRTVNDVGVICDNCEQSIAAQSIELHLLHCQSRIRKCGVCSKPIRISEFGNHKHCEMCGRGYSDGHLHERLFHAIIKCLCGVEVTRATLEEHRASVCSQRLTRCQFCGILTPVGNTESMDARDRVMGFSSEHEARCGNRTERCQICGRLERLKDMVFHIQAFHSV